MEQTLRHVQTAQCAWIQTTSTREGRANGPQNNHALTDLLDHFMGANQAIVKGRIWTRSIM